MCRRADTVKKNIVVDKEDPVKIILHLFLQLTLQLKKINRNSTTCDQFKNTEETN